MSDAGKRTMMSGTISRKAAYEVLTEYYHHKTELQHKALWDALSKVPSAEPEKETAKRVIWTGWKGYRDTRYKCPNCKKPVKNDDVYCHRCGQKLMFPHISWTDYVEGQKQELIVRWDDDQSELQSDTEQGT